MIKKPPNWRFFYKDFISIYHEKKIDLISRFIVEYHCTQESKMIIQDKTIYKNYVQEMTQKVQTLMKQVSESQIPKTAKRDINKQYIKLSAKIALLEVKSENQHTIISQLTWEKSKIEIDFLYTELSNMVDNAIAVSNEIGYAR